MKKICALILFSGFLSFAFCQEIFHADHYKVETTNNPPYTFEFLVIEKGNVSLYIDYEDGIGNRFIPRLKGADGSCCWFDLRYGNFGYERFGLANNVRKYSEYYGTPKYSGKLKIEFSHEDVFQYKMVEFFVWVLIHNEHDVDPSYFRNNVLPKIETRYLRYLRNSVFAVYGYKFSSKDLLEFFSQYPWYAYDPSMTIERINRIMPEKYGRLVEYIKEEEDRR